MESTDTPKLTILAVLSSVIFFLGLTLFEALPEIPVDIDFKPFFIPYMFVALVPLGKPTLAVALGSMLGEFLRDALEGYGIDDPAGAVGFVLSFYLAGVIIGGRPLNKVRLFVAAVVAGSLQAAFEAGAYLLFSSEVLRVAIWSWFGNTITHGIIMGAIPLILLIPRLYGRLERYLGYAPRGAETTPAASTAA